MGVAMSGEDQGTEEVGEGSHDGWEWPELVGQWRWVGVSVPVAYTQE